MNVRIRHHERVRGGQRFFDEAADCLELEDGLREMLRIPWRELRVAVPVRMDDERIEVFTGYRVQHNGVRGPYKGGTRYHPEADQEEIRALASLMIKAYRDVREVVERDGITYRDAAFFIGVGWVAHVARLRGFI